MNTAKKKTGRPGSRRGTALVIVLGMLAVMTLMGIAFSTFIRTERAGMTGLKNNLVARQALHTAVSRVMEAIDLSYGDVSNDWPVCVWPHPWISSSNAEEQDYYQSVAVGSGERPIARIVTKEIADLLTPSQLWLARSAQIGWAPIDASIETTREVTRAPASAQYGNKGLDAADSVIGRYAFVAIETTGLLGVNDVGDSAQSLSDRAGSTGDDPRTFLLPQSAKTSIAAASDDDRALVNDNGTDVPIPTILKDSKKFLQAREGMSREFFPTVSSALSAGSEALNLDVPNPAESALSRGLFPADMFASFAPSLADLDPDGMPKIGLPGTNEIATATAKTVGTFGARAMLAMAKVFANASFDEKSTAGDSEDEYTFFDYRGGNKKYTLSRARLATVALLDAMDPDVIPGRWFKTKDATGSPLYSAWQSAGDGGLPDVSGVKTSVVAANGDHGTVSVSDSTSLGAANRRGNEGALNFPCTEPVPLLNRVYAYMTVDPPGQGDWHEGDGSNSYVRVKGTFHVGAVASLGNLAEDGNDQARKYKMSVECALLLTTPHDSVASIKNAPVPKNILEKIVGVPDPDDPYAFQGRKREWSVDGLPLKLDGGDDAMDVFIPTATDDLSDAKKGNKLFFAQGEMEFEAKLYASAYPDEGDPDDPFGGGGTGQILGDPDIVGGIKHGDYVYFPLTDAEGGPDDLFLPFRFRVSIKDQKSGIEVQRVPAPVLDDNDGSFWLRADAALYHSEDNSPFEGKKDSDMTPWVRDYAPGWAVCLAPAFGFDTSSLWCSSGESNWEIPKSGGYWLNNRLALDIETRAKGPNDPAEWTGLKASFKTIRKIYDGMVIDKLIGTNEDKLTGGAYDPDDPYSSTTAGFNAAQTDGVFDPDSGFALAKAFLAPGTHALPDNLHAYKSNGHLSSGQCLYKDGGPFCMLKTGKISTPRVLAGLYSHVQNAPFKSVGQLGDVMVGPYETLATVRAYRFGTDRADIHRVLDYFTTGDDRYPAKSDYGKTGGPTVRNDGTVDYEDCSELFSGVQAGRVNLNTPPVLRWTDKRKKRVEQAKFGNDKIYNPYPIAAGLAGANLYSAYHSANISAADRAVPQEMALDIATAIATTAGVDIDNDSFPVPKTVTVQENGEDVDHIEWVRATGTRRVKTRLSDIGAAEDGGFNPILEAIVEQIADGPTTVQTEVVDADREAFVANSAGAFTTRGQTFLVIIRADAYTPRYGEETAEDGEGTTLATTHAVVELFRDPVFARFPDGKPLAVVDDGHGNLEVDRDGEPVFFHNWYIKSMRIL